MGMCFLLLFAALISSRANGQDGSPFYARRCAFWCIPIPLHTANRQCAPDILCQAYSHSLWYGCCRPLWRHRHHFADHLGPLIDLASSLQDKPLAPLQPHVAHVISRMMRDEVFHILPRSDLFPMAPRELPREIVGEDPRPDILGKRGKGRPSKRDKAKQSRAAMERLDQWSRTQIDDSEAMMPDEEYVQIRQALAQHKESITSIISTLQK